MSDALGIHLTPLSPGTSNDSGAERASSTDTKLHDVAQRSFSTSQTSLRTPLLSATELPDSSAPIQEMASKAAKFPPERHPLRQKAADTVGEVAERTGAILDAVSTAGAADASGAFSLLSCVISVALALRTGLVKLLPAKAQLRKLDQAIAIIQKAIDNQKPLDKNELQRLLPSGLETPFDNPEKLLGIAKEARQKLSHEIIAHKAHFGVQLFRAALAGTDAIVKILDLGLIALKALGTITGILVIIHAIVKTVKHGKALHSINQQLKTLKNELADCDSQNGAKLKEIQQKISKLTLEKKNLTYQLVIGLAELVLGVAITVIHATTGGLAIPILAGVLGACAIAGLVGDAYFARKMKLSDQETPRAVSSPEAENQPLPQGSGNTSATIGSRMQETIEQTHQALQSLAPDTPLLHDS